MTDSAVLMDDRLKTRLPSWAPDELRRFSPAALRLAIKTRKRRGVTLRVWEVAGKAGRSARTLSNWTSGSTTPDANEMFALAAALRVTLADLSEPAE